VKVYSSIRIKPRISSSSASKMVVAMAMYGNHNKDIPRKITTVANVSDHFSQNGMDFKKEVSKCRNFLYHVPMYENLLAAQWTTQGVTVTKPDHITGEFKEIVSGEGTYNETDYWALFDLAREDFDHALVTGNYQRFLSSVNSGLASIENFLNHQYLIRTRSQLNDEALKKDIEAKFDEWILLFTSKRYDKSGRDWAAFKKLKNLRNEDFQHQKSIASGISFRDLVVLLNDFKYGICQVLMQLHILVGERCPTSIIRYSYYPEIEYVKNG
jgi:hypothetical protein